MKLRTRLGCGSAWLLLHAILWGTTLCSSTLFAASGLAATDITVAAQEEKNAEPGHEAEKSLPITALVGAEIHTYASGGVIEQGVVLIQDGKITAVGGPNLEIPSGAEVLDVSGLIMTPGLIDARSELWLTDAAADSSANDASLDVVDGIDPYSEDWHEVIRQGVTSVYVQPSSAGTLGGYGAVLSVAPGHQAGASDVVPGPAQLAPQAALQALLGGTSANNRTRKQQYDRTKKLLDDALAYRKSWDEYEAYLKKKEASEKQAKEAGNKTTPSTGGNGAKESETPVARPPSPGNRPSGGPPVRGSGRPSLGRPAADSAEAPNTTDAKAEAKPAEQKKEEEKPPKKPERDPIKEKLARVVKGEIPLRLEIHTADDAHFAEKLATEFKDLQVVIEGSSQLGSATQTIAGLNKPMILGPWLAAEPRYRADPDSASTWGKVFSDYSGTLAFGTFGSGPRSSKMLRAHVAKAIAHGFDAQRAMRAVTVDAARILGVGDKLGSIEVGKRADLACFHGEPWNASSVVGLVLVAGDVVYRQEESQSGAGASSGATPTKAEFATLSHSGQLPKRVALSTSQCLLPNGSIEKRTIVIENGKIMEMLPGDVLPGDAQLGEGTLGEGTLGEGTLGEGTGGEGTLGEGTVRINLGDALVTPGLFSAHALLGIERLIDPQSQVDASHVIAADCLAQPFDGQLALLQSGLLRVLLAPGNANPVAGTASVVRLGASDAIVERTAAVKFVLTAGSRRTDRYPSSLAGQLQLLDQSMAGDVLPSRVYLPAAVEHRLAVVRADSFSRVAGGKQLVVIAAETDAEIRAALDLVEKHSLRAMLIGPRQLEPFLERIKALKVAIIVKPARPNDFSWVATDWAQAVDDGIPLFFSGENAEQLRLTASVAVAAGMPPQRALAALCGTSSGYFSSAKLQPGAPADLVVWSASPVNLAAKPLLIVVDGQLVESEAE